MTLSSLHIASLSRRNIELLHVAFQDNGFVLNPKKEASTWLLIVDTIGDPRIASYNRRALRQQKTLIVFKPFGKEAEYAFFHEGTACWACFEQKHRLLDGAATYLYHALNPNQPILQPEFSTTASLQQAFQHIIDEIKSRHTHPLTNSSGILHTLNLATMTVEDHIITQMSSCDVCGHKRKSVDSGYKPPAIDFPKNMVFS